MNTYYLEQRAIAERFERFVADALRDRRHTVQRHVGQKAQYAHGDLCVDGDQVELKRDELLATTGNLFIEIEERFDTSRTWVPSGIWSPSDAAYYAIGDEHHIYVFKRQELRAWQEEGARRVITIRRNTAKGWLLATREAFGFGLVECTRAWAVDLMNLEDPV